MAMAALPMIIMAASAAVSAVGAVRSAQAQSASANYNAQIASQNAQIAEAQGNAAAEAQSRDAQRKIGSALAAAGASGVQTGTGSPADILAESARNATLDNLTVKYNAKLRQMSFLEQSNLDTANAENASAAGGINATSALLQGASSMAGMYGGTKVPSTGTGVPKTG